ncbi:helix-turn-helix domain-containing protein [Catenuloplanes sp. NPDC051500]|uniref:helix-turn-helix domain-containing protein n=1 Tax=Catenuloplanes sp. NPDC051500 TaxID=3363959 RepID=UPI0037AB479A
MAESSDPAVRREGVGELRRLRRQAGLEVEEAAISIDVSPGVLWALEAGLGGVAPKKVRALLAHYGVDDPYANGLTDAVSSEINARIDGARSPGARALIYAEQSARVIRSFELTSVPGLLQTPEYAALACSRHRAPWDDDAAIARRVAGRIARQGLLRGPHAPQAHFLIDEAALRRGDSEPGSAVMSRQIQQLIKAREWPNVTVQVVPATSHAGTGPFMLLEAASGNGDLLYQEQQDSDVISGDPIELASYLNRFAELRELARTGPDLTDFR